MKSIREYSDELGVSIECIDGNYYIELRDYEALLKEFQDLKKKHEIDEEE